MPIERFFLDWARPALESAAEWLAVRRPDLDLTEYLVAVPAGRAGRRLVQLLVERAEREAKPLAPPEVVTVGSLPERLYVPRAGLADEPARRMAWAGALRSADEHVLAALCTVRPDEEDLPGWVALGGLLDHFWTELAGAGLTIRSAADRAARLAEFPDTSRWEAAAQIHEAYLANLADAGMADPHTERIAALNSAPCAADRRIVLLGTPDLPPVVCLMLRSLSTQVTALVFAPPSLADRFDDAGVIDPQAWRDARIELGNDQIVIAESPADQARAAFRALAAMGQCDPSEVTLCAADERLTPSFQRIADALPGVEVHVAAGIPLTRSEIVTFIRAVAEFVSTQQLAELAALVRHPVTEAFLAERLGGLPGAWLTTLDRYAATHVPGAIDGAWSGAEPDEAHSLRAILGAVDELLGDMRAATRRPVSRWAESIAAMLRRALGGRTLSRNLPADRRTLDACEAFGALLGRLAALPSAPACDAASALRLAVDMCAGAFLADDPAPDALELLGWLEMPLDDAPVCIIAGTNEGVVPAAVTADPLLPDSVRAHLGLTDNNRRYARDAYALSAVLASRPSVTLIVGRRSDRNDPLLPSRVLFARDEAEAARFVVRLTRQDRPPVPALVGEVAPGARSAFTRAPVTTGAPPDRFRVTSFGEYLRSPYGYYLRRVQRLEEIDDRRVELDPLGFGSLMHEVLAAFGRSPEKDQTDPDRIAASLRDSLDDLARRRYGPEPAPAVRVQLEQIRARLELFAVWQARRCADGWHIAEVEWHPSQPALFPVEDRPVELVGRIDRIDIADGRGSAILDYKTGESGDTPNQTHRKRDEWRDLQLPLYRHLAAQLRLPEPIELGYILLPKAEGGMRHARAEWDELVLAQADKAAREVILAIRAGCFDDLGPEPPEHGTLGYICESGFVAEGDAGTGGGQAPDGSGGPIGSGRVGA